MRNALTGKSKQKVRVKMELADSLRPSYIFEAGTLKSALVAYSLWITYSHTLVACVESSGHFKYGYQSYPVKECGASKCWSTKSNVSKVTPHLRCRCSFANNN